MSEHRLLAPGSARRALLRSRSVECVALLACLAACARTAWAQTDEIQVYDATIAPTGAFNLTLHNNFTPSGNAAADFPGGIVPDHSLNGAAEWAYGIAPWLEGGLYFPLYSITRDGSILYNGFKLRALFVTPDAANRELFYGVNFEFSFNTAHWDQRAYTSEIRGIVGTHLGRFDIIFNPVVDNSWTGFSKLEFVPESRVAMALTEKYKVALEEYDNFGTISHFLPAAKQSHQLFAVVDISSKVIDIEAGVGAGLTNASDHRVLKLILSRNF